jgi:threonyl-tRNA synthetase
MTRNQSHPPRWLQILTEKDPEGLVGAKHHAPLAPAHVLAPRAVRRMYPKAGIGFGPAIEDGFYYDFDVPQPFTPEDMERIEAEIAKVIEADDPFERRVVSIGGGAAAVRGRSAQARAARGAGGRRGHQRLPQRPVPGPVPRPARAVHGSRANVKLMSVAGAYWRGDVKRQMLQRIYGTAWFSDKDLAAYLHRIEEAKRGIIVAWAASSTSSSCIRSRRAPRSGRTAAPPSTRRSATGCTTCCRPRLPARQDAAALQQGAVGDLRPLGQVPREHVPRAGHESGEHDFSLKPMNCPSHHLMYAAKKHSYRELPIRYATQDVLHRNEVSGALSGLTRVRQFQQDDAHIYLREDQIVDEVRASSRCWTTSTRRSASRTGQVRDASRAAHRR